TCSFSNAQFFRIDPNWFPPIDNPPRGIVLPQGALSFVTTGCTPGSTLTFTFTYPEALPDPGAYWKFGRTTQAEFKGHWYTIPATINGNTATFSITDGGLGDDNLIADGTIVDPGGPGTSLAVAPGIDPQQVPTLSEWAMLALGALMLGMAWIRLGPGPLS